MTPYKIFNPEYGAGTTYSWNKDKYGMWGVGIASFRLKGHRKFLVEIRGSVFSVPCKKIRDFAIKNHTITWRKGVKLYVVPIENFLTWVEDINLSTNL